ncbi:MAG: DUF1501 domain-containing protein [Alphaproteobacteria bacterium]|nr:DUF1501 domain-containing protein [Alphaproteobacteria bacterium]
MTTRRSILKTMAAAGALSVWDAPIHYAFASVPTDRRLVVVVLRGALDGLAAVPPYGDPDYADVRGVLALSKDGANGLHDLDGFFGLHPALTNMKAMYDAKELTTFHNICSPYRDRSHFDGQNVLETGGTSPHILQDGWLNRALKPMRMADGVKAVAVAQSPPLVLDGPAKATSWMPSVLPEPDEEFLARVKALYANDAVLSASLDSALALQAEAQAAMDDPSSKSMMRGGQNANLVPLFGGAGKLLALADGPRVAVLQATGWDTHFDEGAGDGQLARRLQALDGALDALKTSLGPAWSKTAVVMATEFGRTVHVNGSNGTDHGTGGAAFLLGGAVAGGRINAEWVGLKPSALRDGRDQPARTDLRAMFKGVLAEHMGVSKAALESVVFPDSASAKPLIGLVT